MRLLAIDQGPRRGTFKLLSSAYGSRTFSYTAAGTAAAVTDTIKYSAVTSDGQKDHGIVFFDIAGKSSCSAKASSLQAHQLGG
jgi:hypothetical protein